VLGCHRKLTPAHSCVKFGASGVGADVDGCLSSCELNTETCSELLAFSKGRDSKHMPRSGDTSKVRERASSERVCLCIGGAQHLDLRWCFVSKSRRRSGCTMISGTVPWQHARSRRSLFSKWMMERLSLYDIYAHRNNSNLSNRTVQVHCGFSSALDDHDNHRKASRDTILNVA
jgi:hypothetical protein